MEVRLGQVKHRNFLTLLRQYLHLLSVLCMHLYLYLNITLYL